LRGRSRQRRNGSWQRSLGGKHVQWPLRGLESTVGVGAEALQRAIWERSAKE
jgi:hypothetical protein